MIFDWTDACVAHPFIDMIAIGYEEDEAVAARLLDAYLAEWSGVASARSCGTRGGWPSR